jgi:NADH-quinone oxidoreductase subunit E
MTNTETVDGGAVKPSGVVSGNTVFGDETVAEAQQIIARYPQSRSALLPMLHLVQSIQGYVSPAGVAFCASQLGLSTAEVDAVVTFYTMYKRRPCGQHLVSVCTNTLCAVMGGDAIYARLREFLATDVDENNHDGNGESAHEQTVGEPGEPGSITLEHVECLAACDLAPVMQVNYEFFDNQTVDSAVHLADALRNGEQPMPSRGAPLSDFRSVERQLAGFLDTLESDVDGPSAAPETVRGARIANERGWTAPVPPENVPLPSVEEKK